VWVTDNKLSKGETMIDATLMNAVLHTIKRAGSIEDVRLVDEMVCGCGWDESAVDKVLVAIVDVVCHGLHGLNLPVAIIDGVTPAGAESLGYQWVG